MLSEDARVVNISSGAHAAAKIDFENLQFEKAKDGKVGFVGYANSKLANIYFTKELAKKFKDSERTTYSVHPGGVRTEVFRNSLPTHCFKKLLFYQI